MIRPKAFNIAEAKARLPELVQRAARGEEIIIARNGEPQVRLVPFSTPTPRTPGRGVGEWTVAEDFNAPLPPELLEAFEGERDRR
jgi:prevent-host-death family protein